MAEFASSPFFLPLAAWLGATGALVGGWLWMQYVHDRRERCEYDVAPPKRQPGGRRSHRRA